MKKKIFNLITILFLLNIDYTLEYETIKLTYQNAFYIKLKPSQNSEGQYFRFTNYLPVYLLPSIDCELCSNHINDNSTDYTPIKDNTSSSYYYQNFTGNEYIGTLFTENNINSSGYFIAFKNVSYVKNYTGNGLFSLSFLNYNFSTPQKLFALDFSGSSAELHLGGYNKEKEQDSEIKTFNISIQNSTENELNSTWFLNFSKIYINDKLVNGTNSNNLRLLKEEKIDNDTINYKLTFDIAVNGIKVPKNFFMTNLKNIFPEDGKCQIYRSGFFSCSCDETYTTKFANFKFVNEEGKIFYINATDYMTYTSSISGSYCTVYLMINYVNDLFVAGYSVLNNYYDIFDVDNKTFTILINQNDKQSDTATFIILFVVVFSIGIAIFFGGYYCYNKHVINDPNNNFGVHPEEENNNAQNEGGQNNNEEN